MKKKISNYIKSKLQTVLKTKKLKLGKIQSYPLKFSIRKHYYKKDTIVLGDGLHVVHPLAGQGFNLILRDIKKLNDLISENTKLGLPINCSNIPKEFSSNRKPENLLMGLGIDATRIFFKPNQYVDNLKENILEKFAKSKTLKSLTKKSCELWNILMAIYALSSGRGPSGIAIIRISGKETLKICKNLTSLKHIKSSEVNFCKFCDPKNGITIDPEALLLWFLAQIAIPVRILRNYKYTEEMLLSMLYLKCYPSRITAD